jgi:hypothetical protein
MYELTTRYLLDSAGLGHSALDIKAVFMDMREGVTFVSAFENRFGISVADLEAEFFDRMRSFLA